MLDEVWSSYGWATPTQNTPRNKQEPMRMQTRSNSARNSTVYEHRLNRRVKKIFTGSTDVTELAARKVSTGWSDTGINKVSVQPETLHRMIRQNQELTSVQLSRDASNRTHEHRLNQRCQNTYVGVIVQRGLKAYPAEHRLIRRWTNFIRRCNEEKASRRSLVKLHRLIRCP